MCGIIAILSPHPAADLHRRAETMIRLLHHRGPDDRQILSLDHGRIVDPSQPATIALAHSRLSILDLSDAARQPMFDPSRRFLLLYNGEIYNFLELRQDLQRRGESFNSRGDTEVLLRLLAREGPHALPKLDGMFAFLLFDLLHHRLLAARDRFGIKPLYYWIAPDRSLIFASEIKAFTASPGWRADLNPRRASDYLARGLIDHTAETMFDGVRQLPPGHLIELNLPPALRNIAPRPWYSLQAAEPHTPPARWPRHCYELLLHSVTRRLRADVTVGSCLSGGLDSSSIVCLAAEARRARAATGGQQTFTARHPDPKIDEWRYAETVARFAGVDPVDVHLDPDDFFDSIDALVWAQDEPFASPSVYAQYKIFQAAAEHDVTVMLDGQGADEQFAGYHAFFKVYLLELLNHARLASLAGAVRDLRRFHGLSPIPLLARMLGAAMPPPLASLLDRRPALARVVDLDRLGDPPGDPFHAMTGRCRGVRAFAVDQLAAASLPMLLHWEDRNSMAHGVEARVPFLSFPLVEFALGLPASAKLDGRWTKKILREAMRDHVPDPVRTRLDKIAFVTPEQRWFRLTHQQRARRALADSLDACGPLVHDAGRAYLHDVVDARRPYHDLFWRILCFGAWLKRFNVTC